MYFIFVVQDKSSSFISQEIEKISEDKHAIYSVPILVVAGTQN